MSNNAYSAPGHSIFCGVSGLMTKMKFCAFCGESFAPKSIRQKYCCANCADAGLKKAHAENKPALVCRVCGKTFQSFLSGPRYYCSTVCAREAVRARNKAKSAEKMAEWKKPRVCAVCGKEFLPNRPKSLTCSRECRRKREHEKSRAYYRNKKLKHTEYPA